MLNRSASLAMSTSALKALPGKPDIKRHSPNILYLHPMVSVSLNSFVLLEPLAMLLTSTLAINTHYHNSNLIWRTVSRRVDEVIPSDHPRSVASRVIQWYGLIHEVDV